METLVQFTHAYNMICQYGWKQTEKNGVTLHHAMYYDTKASCSGLVSDLLIQARVKATETLKSAFTWKAKHEAKHRKKAEKARKLGKPEPRFKPVLTVAPFASSANYNPKELNPQNVISRN